MPRVKILMALKNYYERERKDYSMITIQEWKIILSETDLLTGVREPYEVWLGGDGLPTSVYRRDQGDNL